MFRDFNLSKLCIQLLANWKEPGILALYDSLPPPGDTGGSSGKAALAKTPNYTGGQEWESITCLNSRWNKPGRRFLAYHYKFWGEWDNLPFYLKLLSVLTNGAASLSAMDTCSSLRKYFKHQMWIKMFHILQIEYNS